VKKLFESKIQVWTKLDALK